MRDLAGRTAVVTGASRGIGPYVARALARERMNLVLAARSAGELEAVAAELRGMGVRAAAVPADVSDRAALAALVEAAEREFGGVDVLVNNAGIELTRPYHRLSLDEIQQVIQVNLTAAMLLARLVLPGMLERGRGHVVNMASLAGKSGPAYSEPYAATKAGLIGFTQSFRATYREMGVSASAVCPGFVHSVGMYEENRRRTGLAAPRSLGTSSPEAVARAVVRAVRDDLPEVLVNPGVPPRVLTTLREAAPSLGEWVVRRMGVTDLYRQAAEARQREHEGTGPAS
ncbi:MAG TPA: SDR family oxidoreductase [Dehalococcoidia bacterium]